MRYLKHLFLALLFLLCIIAPVQAGDKEKQTSPSITLPAFCENPALCQRAQDWRLAWLSSPRSKEVTLYDVGFTHLRKEQKDRFSGKLSVYLGNGEIRKAKGGKKALAAYGCTGKQERLALRLEGKRPTLRKGSWAVVHAMPGETRKEPEKRHHIYDRIHPEFAPSWLLKTLQDWSVPEYANGASVTDAIVPIDLDQDSEKEYWVTRTYSRDSFETPAPRMYSSFALFDKNENETRTLIKVEEAACDCICRDGGCGCCRWDEVTTKPVALFDLEGDGLYEIILERHFRVGQYRYELWRFNGNKFSPTNLMYEDGGC